MNPIDKAAEALLPWWGPQHAAMREAQARAVFASIDTDGISQTLLEHRWDDGGYEGMGFLCICGHITGPGEDADTSRAFSVHIAEAVKAHLLKEDS